MRPDVFDEASTYSDDVPLFQKLGFTPAKYPIWKRVEVGEVSLFDGQAKVKISVEAAPAQFWFAEITDTEGKVWNISTGSGALSDFWPTFELFANGMLSVK